MTNIADHIDDTVPWRIPVQWRTEPGDWNNTTFHFTLTMIALSEEQQVWFDEHAPEWREHMTVREVHCSAAIENFLLNNDAAHAAQYITHRLASEVAHNIADRFEPMLPVQLRTTSEPTSGGPTQKGQ